MNGQVNPGFSYVPVESSAAEGGTWKKVDLRCAVNLAFHLSSRTRAHEQRPSHRRDATERLRARSRRWAARQRVYSSSFNYLINSVSSIIFACVIKPPAKVNNLWRTSDSRSSR